MNGWKLVPVEPDLEMQNEAWRELDDQGIDIAEVEVAAVLRRAIAAAPQPPSVGVEVIATKDSRFHNQIMWRKNFVEDGTELVDRQHVTARDQQIAAAQARHTELEDDFTLLSEDLEHTKRNCSAFEERMGDYQVENGKLRDELIAAQARIQQLEEMIQRVFASGHLSYMQRTVANGEFCDLVDEFNALAQQVNQS